MDYTQYVKAELLVIVPALYFLGGIIKKSETIKDKYIPAILAAVGLALACLWVFGTEGVTPLSVFTAIVQGIICAGMAVFGNQLVKQAEKTE